MVGSLEINFSHTFWGFSTVVERNTHTHTRTHTHTHAHTHTHTHTHAQTHTHTHTHTHTCANTHTHTHTHAHTHTQGQQLMSAECRKTGPHALPEGERVVATLEVFRHTDGVYYMRCRCSRLLDTPDEEYDRSIDHSCSLRETRCPLFMSINASLAWQV